MAICRIKIDYTLYSPQYAPGLGLCLDFRSLKSAKRRARGLGSGTKIIRNFNQNHKDGQIDWWQDERCWYLQHARFERVLPDPCSSRWDVGPRSLLREKLRRIGVRD